MNQSHTTKSQFKGSLVRGLGFGTGISIAFVTTTLFAAAAAMNVFSPGQVISSSELNQNFTMAAPEGAIMAFNLSTCPDGWAAADGTNGTPDLRGRFIRGINDFGTGDSGVDPAGTRALRNIQLDSFQEHVHGPESGMNSFWGQGTGTGSASKPNTGASPDGARTGPAVTDPTHGTPRTTSETRPVNVGLIYCERMN